MWSCFACGEIGYMEISFTWFPRRDDDSKGVPICFLCKPSVIKSIKKYQRDEE